MINITQERVRIDVTTRFMPDQGEGVKGDQLLPVEGSLLNDECGGCQYCFDRYVDIERVLSSCIVDLLKIHIMMLRTIRFGRVTPTFDG